MRRLFALLFCLVAAASPSLSQTYLVATFSNRTNVASFDWLGESMAETIRDTLTEEGYATISREEREEAAKKLSIKHVSDVSLASLAKLCEATGAERLIYGRLEFLPDSAPAPTGAPASSPLRGTLRITARALDVKDVVQIGEFFESGPVQDLAVIETDLTWKVQRWARPGRPIALEDFRRLHPAAKNTARERYVRGLMSPSSDERHRLFTQAVRLDSAFPQPAFALGRDHFLKGNYREAVGWLDRIPSRHLHYLESRFLLALCRYHLSEFDSARSLLQQLEPKLQAPEVWNNLGASQARLGETAALDSFKKALEAESDDTDYLFNVGYSLWKRGEFETAANYFRAVLDHSSDDQDSIQLLGRCLKKSGPRAGDWRTEGLERLKETYEDPAPR